MKITIRIIYQGYASKLTQQASFPVDDFEFEVNSDNEAARVAFVWWKLLKKDLSYQAVIEKVVYNEENDITELVKELDNAPLSDLNLPF
jgi:hypothetical protein